MDRNAIVGAAALRGSETAQCLADARETPPKGDLLECTLGVEDRFATRIKLKNRIVLTAMETRVRLAASETRAGHLNGDEFMKEYSMAWDAYQAGLRTELDLSYQDDARQSAALAALGTGLQQAGRNMQQSYRPPVNCVGNTIGTYTYASCN